MASGNTLAYWTPESNEPPATVMALLNTRNGILVLEYDDTTEWKAIFRGVLPSNYGGNGITVYIHWMAKTATTGNTIWGTEFERDNANNHALSGDSFAAQNASGASAANAVVAKVTVVSIAHTNGAQLDSLAVGDAFRLRVDRVAASGSDTMVGNAQLIAVELRET